VTALVIVDGTDIHHDLLGAALALQSIGLAAGVATGRAVGMQRFVDARPETADVDAYVLYTAGGAFGSEQQEALAAAVAGGKGLFALHASNVLSADSGDRAMVDLLGCRYLSHGPGHHEGVYEVEVDSGHPITDGARKFSLFDEYYVFELSDPGVRVLAWRQTEDGTEPILYVREHGAGRVCYLALGHDMRAWGEPMFQRLVRQGIRWVCQADEEGDR
jgi:type 1 glutamine amidotransferase